jgi:hypothetical protein
MSVALANSAKVSSGPSFHIYILRRDGLSVPHAEDDKPQKNFLSFLKSACNERE